MKRAQGGRRPRRPRPIGVAAFNIDPVLSNASGCGMSPPRRSSGRVDAMLAIDRTGKGLALETVSAFYLSGVRKITFNDFENFLHYSLL